MYPGRLQIKDLPHMHMVEKESRDMAFHPFQKMLVADELDSTQLIAITVIARCILAYAISSR